MLAIQRRLALADLLEENPVLAVEDLALRFAVSSQTIRRDFQYLESRGLVTRTYGGAVARSDDPLSREHAFVARQMERGAQKQAIGAAACALVQPGSTVIMDASTSVLQLARLLPLDIELSAIVYSLPIGLELGRRPDVAVTALGGTLRHTSLSFAGPIAEANLRRLFADTALISARGLALDRGLTEANPYESAIKELVVANASRVVALIDSSKLGRSALSLFAPVAAVDVLVTDDGADATLLDQVRERGVEVIVARSTP
jgi:DeoR/GlpR family transcriptional regulator of sugar metabolism